MGAVVGLRYLVQDGVPTGASDNARAPRTAIGLRADGSVILYTVDGRQSGYSAGLTLGEVASRMIDMGCVTAIELDGGGSTAMMARMPGERDVKLVNRPSDGNMRRNADFIVVYNILPPTDGRAAHLFPQPSHVTMLPNTTASFSFLATDEAFRAVNPPEGPVTSFSGDAHIGVSDGASFTSLNPGDTTVTFTADGASGTAQVRVASRIDSVTFSAAPGGPPVDAVTATPGQTVRLTASAVLDRSPVLSTAQSFVWETEGDIGTVTADGVFTAVTLPGSRNGRITVTAAGTGQSFSIPVTVTAGSNAPFVQIDGPQADGTALSYTLTVVDRNGNLPEDIIIKWDGTPLLDTAWDENRRTVIRVPYSRDKLHILSVKAADSSGLRTRQIDVVEPDVKTNWYDGYVDFLSDRFIIFTGGGYDPNQPITRMEVFRMILRTLNLPAQNNINLPFDDISGLNASDLVTVRSVYATGLVNGKPRQDGSLYLDPDGLITRAELFTLLSKTLSDGYDRASLSAFSDSSLVPPFALQSTEILVGMGVVSGSGGRLNPGGSILRSEACAFFCQFFY
jgi:hypothetical protein